MKLADISWEIAKTIFIVLGAWKVFEIFQEALK